MAKKPEKSLSKAMADEVTAPPPPRKIFGLSKSVFLLGVGLGLALVGGLISYFLHTPELTPGEKLRHAFRFLDDRKLSAAREMAQELEAQNYRDPDFPGAIPFILGMVLFREAEGQDEQSREPKCIAASVLFRDAERLSLSAERRPEWAYALGVSLHRVGSTEESIPLLEEAVRTYSAGKAEAALVLAETYLLSETSEDAERALKCNAEIMADASLSPLQRDHVLLQRAQILLALGKRADAEQVLSQVSQDHQGNQGSAVLRAQTLMADGKYSEAIKLLSPIVNDIGLERTYASQASFLMGVCADKLNELENAVSYYTRTAERFDRSHEAVAAQLGAAEARLKLGQHEKALESYAIVLRHVRRPQTFRNRWLTLTRLRESVLSAWNKWMDLGNYAHAIPLAELMSPVIPYDESLELVARANQTWAEKVAAEVAQLPIDQQAERQAEVRLRWQQGGHAYARLAQKRRSSTAFADALWIAADDFIKGHDFRNAVRQLTLYIDSRSTTRVPAAMVRRGQTYMDLDHWEEALRDFEDTLATFPTDPASFQARYLMGICYYERNDLPQAERIWREILDSPDLTPKALEWRQALFSLGKLLYFSGEQTQRLIKRVPPQNRSSEAQQQLLAAYSRFEETVRKFEEFVDRYPDADDVFEARFMLARALQRSAELPEERVHFAETDQARAEFRRQMLDRFERAAAILGQLQTDLLKQQGLGRLNSAGRSMLRNCYFDSAQCLYALGRYEEAITSYTSYAARYQHLADSLTCYVQIANCYDRLRKPAESLSTLVQAQLILKGLSDSAFPDANTGLTRAEWERWLDWAVKIHQ